VSLPPGASDVRRLGGGNINEAFKVVLEDGREALDALPCRKLGVVIVGESQASSRYHHYGYSGRQRT